MSALNPKASLLIKLAEMVGVSMADQPHLDDDPEVLEWYDRMAELKYVPARLNEDGVSQSRIDEAVSNLRGVPTTHNAVLALAIEDSAPALGEIRMPLSGIDTEGNLVSEVLVLKPGDKEAVSKHSYTAVTGYGSDVIALCVGYQIFATHGADVFAEDVASYTEAVSVDEAMQKCLEQFPAGEGYTAHGVKDIETQVVTMTAYKTVLDLD